MDPILSEIRAFGCNFAPRGWAKCDGQLLPISQYTALFSLLGTTYGGDGRTTFGLPDLRGRVAMSMGNGPGLSDYYQGQRGGAEEVTLTSANLPSHGHQAMLGATETFRVKVKEQKKDKPDKGNKGGIEAVAAPSASGATALSGDGQPHTNLPPYLVINYCMAVEGTYPSRN